MRIALLFPLAIGAIAASCTEPVLTEGTRPSNAEVFDALWRDFDLSYSFFKVKAINWDSAAAVNRPLAIAATNDTELARVLARMLGGLRDRHVTLTAPGVSSTVYMSHSDSMAVPFNANAVEKRYVSRPTETNGGHVRFGFLSTGVGYVRIPSFEGNDWIGEFDAAMAALHSAQGIVVDVRSNPGGSHGLAIDAAGRFASARTLYSYVKIRNGPSHDDFSPSSPQVVEPSGDASVRFAGPVVVLTNRRMYSSAEDFALAMKALPQVTPVGDTTGGASGRPVTREMANGWSYTLSTWVEYEPNGQVFENIGIAPDVYVPSRMADVATGVDPVIEKAVELVNAKK